MDFQQQQQVQVGGPVNSYPQQGNFNQQYSNQPQTVIVYDGRNEQGRLAILQTINSKATCYLIMHVIIFILVVFNLVNRIESLNWYMSWREDQSIPDSIDSKFLAIYYILLIADFILAFLVIFAMVAVKLHKIMLIRIYQIVLLFIVLLYVVGYVVMMSILQEIFENSPAIASYFKTLYIIVLIIYLLIFLGMLCWANSIRNRILNYVTQYGDNFSTQQATENKLNMSQQSNQTESF